MELTKTKDALYLSDPRGRQVKLQITGAGSFPYHVKVCPVLRDTSLWWRVWRTHKTELKRLGLSVHKAGRNYEVRYRTSGNGWFLP